MMAFLAFTQAAAQALDWSPLWEPIKGVMLFASTGLLGWIATTLRRVERQQINQQHILVGVDGDNGLKGDVAALKQSVKLIEERNIAIDAVEKAEREKHHGPERRVGAQRLRDVVHEAFDERHRIHTDEHRVDP